MPDFMSDSFDWVADLSDSVSDSPDSDATYFWEYQLTDSHGVGTWERYDPTVQAFISINLNSTKTVLFLRSRTRIS
eukprot:m.88339 g.88339  ORF g.88339 m.88339 type:complete len:76 (+) comp26182_c0_seq2:164-391(+)